MTTDIGAAVNANLATLANEVSALKEPTVRQSDDNATATIETRPVYSTYQSGGEYIVTMPSIPYSKFSVRKDEDCYEYPEQEDVYIHVYRSGYPSTTKSDHDLARIFTEFYDRNASYGGKWRGDAEKCADATNRLATIAGIDARVYPFRTRGYSQSDWADIIVILDRPSDHWTEPERAAESIAREWENWARGDVYSVAPIDPETGEAEEDERLHGVITDDPVEAARWY